MLNISPKTDTMNMQNRRQPYKGSRVINRAFPHGSSSPLLDKATYAGQSQNVLDASASLYLAVLFHFWQQFWNNHQLHLSTVPLPVQMHMDFLQTTCNSGATGNACEGHRKPGCLHSAQSKRKNPGLFKSIL